LPDFLLQRHDSVAAGVVEMDAATLQVVFQELRDAELFLFQFVLLPSRGVSSASYTAS
jgi:hypothetical protein